MTDVEAGSRKISLRRAVAASFTEPFRKASAILPRVILPWLVGGLFLYFTWHFYLAELGIFLLQPSERIARVGLGMAMAGLLLALFFHTMISASTTGVLLGMPERPIAYWRARRREWTLYAANLCLLLFPAFGIVLFKAGNALLGSHSPFIVPLAVGAALVSVWFIVPAWFLSAPISVARGDGTVLRAAWQLHAGMRFPS